MKYRNVGKAGIKVSEIALGSWMTDLKESSEEDVAKEVTLEEFVPRYTNQAIIFTGDDMGGDRSMMIVLLYIIIVIMAFVFAITTSNTIRKEANVIGTLRASGYTRGELIRHYMAAPVFVTFIGAIIGNIIGKWRKSEVERKCWKSIVFVQIWHWRKSISSDNGSADPHYACGEFCAAVVQIKTITTEVPEKGLKQT